MQLRLPWSDPAPATADAVVFVRHRRARRFILRVLHDGTVRVTLPRWGAKRDAARFLEDSRDWIERQRALRRARVTPPATLSAGQTVLVDGEPQVLRLVTRPAGVHIVCGQTVIANAAQVPRDLRPAVERWLRARAQRELPNQLRALAAVHEIAVPRISIRNQRSRWGACSHTGTVTLNWRLVQVPPFVREYVLVHELMHRRELNHSRRFWRLVARCCPRMAEARMWLRKEGKTLWSDTA